MLYVTTRDKKDAYTVSRVLLNDRGPDGGLFVPFQLPTYSQSEIEGLKEKSFGQRVADILNLFFSARLTGWDVDFSIGRTPVKLVQMNYRIVLAETWHNQQWEFSWVVSQLMSRIRGNAAAEKPSAWTQVAVRIAVLFGIFGELIKSNKLDYEHPVDIAVPSGDFALPLAAWYARKIGLPIGTIICSCNENGAPWDLLNYGQVHTDTVAVKTDLPEADFAVPPHMESLIFNALGYDEAVRFCEACHLGKTYKPDSHGLLQLRDGMFAAVVSPKRVAEIIPRVDRSSSYLMDPYAALAYGGLQDYRAKTGESRTTLIVSEKSPSCYADMMTKVLGLSYREFTERVNKG